MHVRSSFALIVAAGLLAVTQTGALVLAQTATAGSTTIVRSSNPSKENLQRMQKAISVDFDGTRLDEALKSIADQTGADFEVLFKGDGRDGLDAEAPIKLIEKNLPAIAVLQRILAKVTTSDSDEATWQFNDVGRMQIGRKAELVRFRRVEIYSIRDLLLPLPVYPDVPEVNLQQALQSGGGGGGPFTQPGGNRTKDPKAIEEERRTRGEDIIAILVKYAEKEWWNADGITRPQYFDGNIIVDAPDFMHRALVGYSWWPSSSNTAPASARRYVSLSSDSAISTVANFRPFPVTAAVPGGGG